ncbi:hypothetical protein [Chloroflexus sp.]|uniref:hypothetical protein n=1 Tax=Chloroflexus sp. TaxID=1904827 RepID=UPI002ADE1AC3|nr:hypothetical protein [Chloroflexus sp.]
MNRFRDWLLHIDATDPEIQRRGKILVSLSSGVVVLLLTVGLALTLIQPTIGRLINLTWQHWFLWYLSSSAKRD